LNNLCHVACNHCRVCKTLPRCRAITPGANLVNTVISVSLAPALSAIFRDLIWRFTCLFVDGERTVYAERHSISRRAIERCSSSRAIRAHAVREPGGQHAVAVCECALSRELSRLESEKYFVECSAKF